MAASSGTGGGIVVAAGPRRAQRHAPSPLGAPTGSRRTPRIPSAPPPGWRQGRGAEPVQPEPAARLDAGDPQRPVADHPAAQQRRGGDVVEPSGRRTRSRPGRRAGGVAAVAVPAGEPGRLAEVLARRVQNRQTPQVPASQATPTRSPATTVASTPSPTATHPPDHLVAGYHRQPARRQVAFDDLEVGAAHRAGTRPRRRPRRHPGSDRPARPWPMDASSIGPGVASC